MPDERFWIGLHRYMPVVYAGAMVFIAWGIWRLPEHAGQSSKVQRAATALVNPDEDKARAHAADALKGLLTRKTSADGSKLSESGAATLANGASEKLFKIIKDDPTGETARVFGEWIRARGQPDTSKQDAAVLPYFQRALKEARDAAGQANPSLLETAGKIFDAIGSDDIKSIRDGFFGGLGGLPWDIVKDLISGAFDSESDREIEVKCACCQGKDKDGDKKDGGGGTCPPPPPCPGPNGHCPSVLLEEFQVPFDPDEHAVKRAQQTAPIDKAAALAQQAGALVTLWARTDTTASDDHNVRLARLRGDAVKLALRERGVSEDRIRAAPLGEYALLEPTAQNVPNANNRKLSIEVWSQRAGPQ